MSARLRLDAARVTEATHNLIRHVDALTDLSEPEKLAVLLGASYAQRYFMIETADDFAGAVAEVEHFHDQTMAALIKEATPPPRHGRATPPWALTTQTRNFPSLSKRQAIAFAERKMHEGCRVAILEPGDHMPQGYKEDDQRWGHADFTCGEGVTRRVVYHLEK